MKMKRTQIAKFIATVFGLGSFAYLFVIGSAHAGIDLEYNSAVRRLVLTCLFCLVFSVGLFNVLSSTIIDKEDSYRQYNKGDIFIDKLNTVDITAAKFYVVFAYWTSWASAGCLAGAIGCRIFFPW